MHAFSLLVLGGLSLTACGPSAEFQRQLADAQTKVTDLGKTSTKLEDENADLVAKVRRLEVEVDRLRKREVYFRLGIEEGQTLSVTFDTSLGDVNCTLWPDKSPQTVLNFIELADGRREWTDPRTGRRVQRKLYDGTIFHRVIPGFMIQGGDPLGDGTGGPGYKFADEVDNGVTFDQPGLLAMANSGPDTNGSQFFITDRATPTHLDGKHSIFGKCDNLDIIAKIADTPRGARDRPIDDVVLKHVIIDRTD